VAQPSTTPSNITRFNLTFTDTSLTSHAMRWLAGRVEYRVWRGGPDAESPATRLASWTYSGPQLPRLEAPRVHLNLWQFNSPPATNQEAVFENFTFRSDCPNGDCSVLSVGSPPRHPDAIRAAPNPFLSATRLRFTVPAAGPARLDVFDLAGRRVRALWDGPLGEGEHELSWDGRDGSGRRVPAGLYLYRLTAAGQSVTGRVLAVD
jgi:hypothetical protein